MRRARERHLRVQDGILLNGVITLTGGAAYLILLPRLLARGGGRAESARAMFFFLVGAHLALAGLRQLVAAGAQAPSAFIATLGVDLLRLDVALFYLASLVGGASVIALAYLAFELAGKRRVALAVGLGLGVVASLAFALLLRAPLSGPHASAWGSDWRVESLGVSLLLASLAALPALVSIALMLWTRRMTMLACAALVYYAALIPDALGLAGIPFMVARVAAASSALLAWEAVRIPAAVTIAAPARP